MTESPTPEPSVPPMPTTAPTAPPAQTRRRTLTTALIGALVGAAAVGTAWLITADDDGAPTAQAATAAGTAHKADDGTFTLTGSFTLTEDAVDDGMGGCEGTGGYDDITMGASVTVYDAADTIVGTSSLILSTYDDTVGSCEFDVSVDDVPGDQDFYQVEIGHRGKVQMTSAEAKGGEFAATLG